MVFWPIGTRPTTYQVYDTNTERAWPATYRGTAVVQGLSTYVFTQRIPATVVQQLPGVPTSLLDLPGPSRNVVADRTFQAVNTFWVDPRTGVPVNAEERILSVLYAPGGRGQLVVASADLTMTPASQRWLARPVQAQRRLDRHGTAVRPARRHRGRRPASASGDGSPAPAESRAAP